MARERTIQISFSLIKSPEMGIFYCQLYTWGGNLTTPFSFVK